MPVRMLSYAISAVAIIVMVALFAHALLYGNYTPLPQNQVVGSNWMGPAAISLFAVVAGVAISRYGRDSQR